MAKTLERKALEWLVGNDTGMSSCSILTAILGLPVLDEWRRHGCLPSDYWDFGRCRRLLEAIPEFATRMHEVTERFPRWGPMVDAWGELDSLYDAGDKAAFRARIRKAEDAGNEIARSRAIVIRMGEAEATK